MQTILQKKQIVSDLTEKLQQSSAFYFVDFSGMNVELFTELRNKFFAKNITMQVVKNTLLRRVLIDCNFSSYDKELVGSTAIILADTENPIEPAKIFVKFHKKNKDLMKVKLINFESTDYSSDQLEEVSKMLGKKDLQSQIISLALGSGSNLIGIIKGSGQTIVSQIKSLIERLEE